MNEEMDLSENSDIQKALKEFETKSSEQHSQNTSEASKNSPDLKREISGVVFDTDSYKAVKFYNETDTPKVIKLVMKHSGGAVKNERQAEYFLLGLVAFMIILSIVIFIISGPDKVPISAPSFT